MRGHRHMVTLTTAGMVSQALQDWLETPQIPACPLPPDPRALRDASGCFMTGVTVVTTTDATGKTPFSVFDGADLDLAVNARVSGILAATAQSCVAASPPPLCSEGVVPDGAGFCYPPTILDCSDVPDAPCVRQALFGPVLSVMTFDTGEQHLADDTAYGLASGVIIRSQRRAQRMIRGIRAGIVWVNACRAVSPTAPFGRPGLPGHGRAGHRLAAAREYTCVKTV